jgi:chromatin segregation and condensation protein Rec8/ScpA/Scc1 (kleisin family)
MRNQILLRRSAWSSTLIASLELAKQGAIGLHQEESFTPIYASLASAEGAASGAE